MFTADPGTEWYWFSIVLKVLQLSLLLDDEQSFDSCTLRRRKERRRKKRRDEKVRGVKREGRRGYRATRDGREREKSLITPAHFTRWTAGETIENCFQVVCVYFGVFLDIYFTSGVECGLN